MSDLYKEYRCPNDDKLLFKGVLVDGEVEIKCKGCRELVKVAPTPLDELICVAKNCDNRENVV